VLLATLALAIPSAARAQDALSQVCSQLIGSQVTQCMGAAAGRYIDPKAANTCGQLIGGQVVSCIGAIAGKVYNHGETQTCGELIGGQVIDCLRTTGRVRVAAPPPEPAPAPYYQNQPPPAYPPRRGPLTTAEIRSEIAAALEQLRANDPMGTERRLRRLLNDLR
jgi:hypothetical protein